VALLLKMRADITAKNRGTHRRREDYWSVRVPTPRPPLNTFIRPVRGGGGICPPPFPIPPLSLTAAPVWFEQRRPCRQRDGAAADRPRPGPPTRERRGCGEWSEIDRRPSERASQADPCARIPLLGSTSPRPLAGFVGGLAGGGWLPPPQITLLSEAWSELEAERARLGAELLASAEVVPRPPTPPYAPPPPLGPPNTGRTAQRPRQPRRPRRARLFDFYGCGWR
jgi:hypothetical protein